MSRSGTRDRLNTVALMACAMLISGCAPLQVPRIDPTGERVFAEPPLAVAPQYRVEPGTLLLPWDDVEVTLAPRVIVAPVGSEVVLVAGVRGADNYLRTNRRLEWSLAPGGVGHFVAVGKGGAVDLLLGDFNRPRKVDNTFAIGSTSRSYLRLDRGTPTIGDDVCVLAGQGWVTLSSPIEGTSYATVYAPEVRPWDSRKRSAMVHWVDAQWAFPPPAINPTGTTHVFTTTVMRQSDQCPCVGWRVRYEIVGGPAAGFAPEGAPSVEVPTDAAGQASVEIAQKQPGPGTNQITIQVIRPAALGGTNGKPLVVGSGTTLKTWTAPALAVRKLAPAVASLAAVLNYRIEVSNPGDMPAADVVVTDELPESLAYVQSNPAAEVNGQTLRWQLGPLGAGECRPIELSCRAVQPGSVTNCAAATAAGGLKASHAATTTVTAPTVEVKLSGPTEATVGSEVTFSALVTNVSQVPATGLLIKDRFGPGFEHAVAPSPIERELGDLAPGETRQIDVTFRVTRAGRLCHTVEVTGAGGLKAGAEACLTAVAAAPATPAPQEPPQQPPPPTTRSSVTIKKTVVSRSAVFLGAGPQPHAVGEMVRFAIDVTNTGNQPLTEVKLLDQYDPDLDPQEATPGFKLQGNNLVYTIATLPAGATEQLEVLCKCLQPAQSACNRATVTTQDGVRVQGEACLEIRAAPGNLTMTVADLRDPVTAGKELTYEILVTNQGQSPERQVSVTATVPVGMTAAALGSSGPIKFQIEGQTVRFDPVAEIRPGETATYRVRVATKQPGKEFLFRAQVTSATMPQGRTVDETTEVTARLSP